MTFLRVSRTPPAIQITVRDGNASVEVPWTDEWFVRDLTQAVPPSDRRWNAGEKTWTVDAQHVTALTELVRQAFAEPEIREV